MRLVTNTIGIDGAVALLSLLAAWLLCTALGVPFTGMFMRTLAVFEPVIYRLVVLPALVVLFIHMITIGLYYPKGHTFTTQDLRDHWNRSFLEGRNLWHFFRALVILVAFTTAVTNTKPLIPLVNRALFDDWLLRLDLAVCGGFDIFAWCSGTRTPFLDALLSFGYQFIFFSFVFSFGLLFMQKRPELRVMVLAYMFVYIVGIIMHFALPSLGDVYIRERTHLYDNLTNVPTRGLHVMLWMERMRLLENPSAYIPTMPFIGVAAFPSLHCAHMAVLLYVAWRCHKLLLLVYVPGAALLIAATIYFGWHYISDCVVGLGLGYAMVYVAIKLLKWESRFTVATASTAPAL